MGWCVSEMVKCDGFSCYCPYGKASDKVANVWCRYYSSIKPKKEASK